MATTFKLTVAYDGTGLVGWQRQASGISVQGLLEDALSDLDGRHVAVTGAGRTDAGVHARGQVASVSIERAIDGVSLMRAVNARLPPAVRVTSALEVPAAFHARFEARSKTYRYRIWNGDVMSPFERAYAWHVPAPVLNVAGMAAGGRASRRASRFRRVSGRRDRDAGDGAGRVRPSRVVTAIAARDSSRTRFAATAFSDTWCAASSARSSKSDASAGRSSGLARCCGRAIAPARARLRRPRACS